MKIKNLSGIGPTDFLFLNEVNNNSDSDKSL